MGGIPGGNILPAAQAVHDVQTERGATALREFGGPRFAEATARRSQEFQGDRAREFDLFSQNVLEQQAQRQLQGLLGAGQLSIGQGQVANQGLGALTGLLGTAGGFANQMQGQQMPLIQQLLGAGLFGGGVTQDPTFVQSQSTLMSALTGAFGGASLGLGLGGGGANAGFGANFGVTGAQGADPSIFIRGY